MTYEDITKYTSPNSTAARDVPAVFGQARKVKSITIHHWGSLGQRFQDVVNYLCTPWQNRPDRRQSSAHYVIEAGRSACIIDPDDAAWHSDNATGNATSIGLELRPEATAADYATAAEVIRDLRKAYGDVPLVPHRSWTSTACPGQWDLARLDRLARGGTVTTASTSKPAPIKEDTLSAAEVKEIKDYIAALLLNGYSKDGKNHKGILDQIIAEVKNPLARWTYKGRNQTRDTYAKLNNAEANSREAVTRLTALDAAVRTLAESKGVDPAAVQATVDSAVKDALAGLEITLATQARNAEEGA
jgi:N-acetylmuramoyl-L-alanine amidase